MKKKSQNKSQPGANANAGAGRKENVRGSGVYPVSGPWPKGRAPIRSEAEWGEGPRSRRRQQEAQGEGEREIPRNQWVKFLDQFSKVHDGWPTTVKVTRAGKRRLATEARALPLQGITVDLKNRADRDRTSIILDMQPNVHLTHSVPETKRVISRENELEIEAANGDRALVSCKSPRKK